MKVYLASPQTAITYGGLPLMKDKFILDTYHDLKKKKDISWLDSCRKDFLLDSGAYTYMRGNGGDLSNIDWDKYIFEYAEFVKKHQINNFFELDIDKIIGYDNVQRLTKNLNSLTGKRCLPVWHKSRGLDEWEKSTRENKYVSLSASGNNGSSEWTREKGAENILYRLNDIAIKNDCKVHALGYTKVPMLRKIPFYSVDSTGWLRGIYGLVYKFNPLKEGCFDKYTKVKGQRMITKNTQLGNFQEWLKFQDWAKTNL